MYTIKYVVDVDVDRYYIFILVNKYKEHKYKIGSMIELRRRECISK